MKIRCIALDDENLAVDLIRHLLINHPQAELIGSFTSPKEAFACIEKEKPDLLFLDINMPDLTGLEIIPLLKYKPAVVMITAYSEFAFQAFDLDVVDYVLKPYLPERLHRAIAKAQTFLNFRSGQNTDNAIYVKDRGILEKIQFHEINYIQGLKQYVKIATARGNFIHLSGLSELHEKLPQTTFRRIHKSYIVSLDAITAKQSGYLFIGNEKIPIGRQFKNQIPG